MEKQFISSLKMKYNKNAGFSEALTFSRNCVSTITFPASLVYLKFLSKLNYNNF